MGIYNDTDLTKIEKIFNISSIVSAKTLDIRKYTVCVQEDIKKLALAFKMDLGDVVCENINKATWKISEYLKIIKVDLFNLVKEYFKNENIKDQIEQKNAINNFITLINENKFTKYY